MVGTKSRQLTPLPHAWPTASANYATSIEHVISANRILIRSKNRLYTFPTVRRKRLLGGGLSNQVCTDSLVTEYVAIDAFTLDQALAYWTTLPSLVTAFRARLPTDLLPNPGLHVQGAQLISMLTVARRTENARSKTGADRRASVNCS